MIRRLVLAPALLAAAGCASVFNGPDSEVTIATDPAGARCVLSGAGGFSAEITAPATLDLPHKAAPVTVSCEAPGRRRTVNTLYADGSTWLWGNSALIAVTGGAAVFGLVVDEAMGATGAYPKDFNVRLDTDAVRQLRATQRRDGSTLDIRSP